MMTFFDTKDLVSFWNYMVSEDRKKRVELAYNTQLESGVETPTSIEDKLLEVSDADLDSWMEINK